MLKKIGRPLQGVLMGEEKPVEELRGNLSLLRGCLRHSLDADNKSMPESTFFIHNISKYRLEISHAFFIIYHSVVRYRHKNAEFGIGS